MVFIDCHDLGRHLGAYGQETVSSPNLDRLAEDGVCFEGSFCTAPQCSPSRAGLYTGRYAHAAGMLGLAHDPFNWRLHQDEAYLAGHFQRAGYRTALIGVQHVTAHQEEAVRGLGFDHVVLEDSAALIPGLAAAWLDDVQEEAFFLNIGFMIPHRDPGGHYHQAPADDSLGVQVPGYLPDTPEARREFSELQGVIRQMDAAVGALRGELERRGLMNDTWMIFTTDHGLAMPRAKCTMYDPGIETALIMYAPTSGITGSRRFKELISNVDIVPTILECLEMETPDNLHGSSFAGLLRGNAYSRRKYIFAEKTFHTAYEPQRAVRSDRYKLIWNAEIGIVNVPGDVRQSPIYPQMLEQITQERPALEFYDLKHDPLEQQNLISDPEYESEIEDLRETLHTWMKDTNDPLLNGPPVSPFYRHSLNVLKGTNHEI